MKTEKSEAKMRKTVAVHILWIIYAFIILSAGALSVFAQPAINNTSGTVDDGAGVTINGGSFGTTGPAIYKWDDFEGNTHTVGQNIGIGPGNLVWDDYTNSPPYTHAKISDTAVRTNSTKHVRTTLGQETGYSTAVFQLIDTNEWPIVYMSMYLKWNDVKNSNQTNEKFWRIAGGGWDKTMPYIRYVSNDNSSRCIDPEDVGIPVYHPYIPAPNMNEWIRMDIYAVQSDLNTYNGTINFVSQHSENGIFYTDVPNTSYPRTDYMTRTVEGGAWHGVVFENYLVTNGIFTHDYDDIYIANSRARVEIGNMPTWDTCTHREIQIPAAWADNLITMTFNQGSFNNGDTVYLYVVDENNNVNANGFPITIGQGTNSFDINSDGKVDITDIQACVNHILGTQVNAKADVNSDGKVDVIDVQSIVNTILNN